MTAQEQENKILKLIEGEIESQRKSPNYLATQITEETITGQSIRNMIKRTARPSLINVLLVLNALGYEVKITKFVK